MQKYALSFLLAGFFVLLNWVTLSRSPTVWQDEVSYTDPAVNLVQGKGFVSTAWYQQNDREFWAGNVPLHQFALAGWLQVFPVTPVGVRAFGLFLLLGFVALVFRIKQNLGLWSSQRYDAALLTLLFCGPGVLFAYRTARPDMILFCVGGLMGCGLTERNRKAGLFLLCTASFLMPWAGIQGIPWFAFFFAFLQCLLFAQKALPQQSWGRLLIGELPELLKRAGAMAAFASLGLACLLSLYHSHGVLSDFWVSTFGSHTAASDRAFSFKPGIAGYLLEDIVFILVNALLLVEAWRSGCRTTFCAWAFALLAAFPMVMGLLAKYPVYYHAMGFVMETLLCLYLLSRREKMALWVRRSVWLACLLVALAGLPARTVLACAQWKSRDYAPYERFLAEHIRSDDVVFSTWSGYYALNAIGAKSYYPCYVGDYANSKEWGPHVMSDQEKQAVTVVVQHTEWDVPVPLVPFGFQRVAAYDAKQEKLFGRSLGALPYRVTVWRKKMGAP